ncbi:NAD-dependent epimerase/dehydratase family protein [Mariprofundus sp. KV]|uniref:NAD-dependent epimerase/dehydratase family protein n=1 Tax=Mariprofundus sp. KV TaxID=2608715 RepID=UPI0015A01043|nr:NAD-dependent epimerase/dehydratase family protein [Mariprofundus sp. KV]NWF36783.1 NAD-dependent epimerase/dehydratase family protein [Mariprofundus sp. KV]
MKNVLVTGATGFIGKNLCGVLSRKHVDLNVLGRKKTGFNAKFHLWNFEGDLDPDCLHGIDTVFHLAGKAHALAETNQDVDQYSYINTDATERLLQACQKAGVKTFVYFSSVKAAGDIEGSMDELVSVLPDTPYGQSKKASEELVLEGGYVPHPVVIRPTMVYGNTEKGNLPKMIKAIDSGKFPPLPEVNNRRSMVHVDDVVQAAMLAAEHAEAAGQIYIVTDGESYSTRQMYEWICEALHKPLPVWNLPLFVLKLLAKVGDLIGALRGRRFVFDSDGLDKLTGSASYSSAKIERQLGFKANRNLREALPEIAQYLGVLK